VLALVLRLPWTVPVTSDLAHSFAAAFGEHALCLSATADPASDREAPAGPGGHGDHHAAKCCQSHLSGNVVLPAIGGVIRIVFVTPADRFTAVEAGPAARSLSRSWARAPPVFG